MDKGIKAARLADQIRDYLARWIHQEYPHEGISITQVTLTPDLGKATIWIQPFDSSKSAAVLKNMRKKQGAYQRELVRTLRRRAIPHISFSIDTSKEVLDRFDDLLKQ